jgi:hypothetical protein
MASDLRRERWRATHARLARKRRPGGDGLMSRQKIAIVRGGVVDPGALYSPLSWDATDTRVRNVRAYRPNYRPGAWAGHQATVIDLVLRLDHDINDPLRDRHWAGTLHAFFTWAEDNAYSTDPAALLTDSRMVDFIEKAYENKATRATHQYRLRCVAALIFPAPSSAPIPRTPAQPPHSVQEREVFLAGAKALIAGHNASLKTRRDLHRDVVIILALTFGAGCNSSVVHRLTEASVLDGPEGMWLNKPDQEMPVPVGERWAAVLRATRTGDGAAYLVSPSSTGKRNERVGKVMARARSKAATLRGFDSDRAAKCWQVGLLTATGFDVVAAMCGFRANTQMPADLIPHLPAREFGEIRAMARTWSR